MVLVPAGDFVMGADRVDTEGLGAQLGLVRPLYEDEHQQQRMRLPAYFIDIYETTNRRYAEFVRQTGHAPPPNWSGGRYPPGRDEHPVVFVSWYDAVAYCGWIKKRLPTEAEWEQAARGTEGLEYPWGAEFDPARANTGSSDTNDSSPVGQFSGGRSPFGVEDMIGNAAEWVDAWFLPYPGNPQLRGPLYGQRFKVIRGGSWGGSGGHYAMAIFYRAAHRLFGEPTERLPDTGFRCAQSA